MATAAQIIESEQGTEFAAAVDQFAEQMTEYDGSGIHSLTDFHERVSKLCETLNTLGMTIPAVPAVPTT